MSAALTHRTSAGDRWDLLAETYYGDPCLLPHLTRANPAYAHLPTLPAGLTLTVPVLEDDATAAGGDYTPWSAL